MSSDAVPRWLERLVVRLQQASWAEPTLFETGRTRDFERATRLYAVYERIDASLFPKSPDAFESVSLPSPGSRPLSELEDCDVVLDPWDGEMSVAATRARYGVWVLTFLDEDEQRLEPPLFWETYRRGVYHLQVEALLPDGGRRALFSSVGATDATSLHRARNAAYWKAQKAVFDQLRAVAHEGWAYLNSRPSLVSIPPEGARMPHATTVLRHMTRIALGVIARRLHRTVYRSDWFIAARPYAQPASGKQVASLRDHPFVPICSPRGSSCADPFVFEERGQTYLFFEQATTRDPKGVISCIILDDSAAPVGPPVEVLSRPYHVSYPFVFARGGEIFMIPESSENRTIELYRATAFPTEWTLEEVLFHDIFAVDATLHEDQNRLWLFTTVAEPGAPPTEDLHIYFSDRLAGPWEPHADNPVVSDVRSARPAGRIFRRGGDVIRPAQDSSHGYGFSIVFNRIERLTPLEYQEREVERIEPVWLSGISATHTYNFGGFVEVVDARRRILKPPLDRLTHR